jgi:hypothetical protein
VPARQVAKQNVALFSVLTCLIVINSIAQAAIPALLAPFEKRKELSTLAYCSTFQIPGSVSPSILKTATPRTFSDLASFTFAPTAPASLHDT